MKTERALSEKELAILDKRSSLLKRRASRTSKFIVIWLFIAVTAYIYFYFKFQRDDLRMLLSVVVACYIGIGLWIVTADSYRRKKEREDIKYLENHTVTVYRVNSVNFVLFIEEEDEGCHYMFQISDNKILSFGGQDFYPSRNFPSDNFEIVEGRNKNGDVIIQEVYNYGIKIQPLKTIRARDKGALINKFPDPTVPTITEGRLGLY